MPNTDALITLLVERGGDGVTLQDLASLDPRAAERELDFRLMDDDIDDHVIDRGPRGVTDLLLASAWHALDDIAYRGGVIEMRGATGPLRHVTAVLHGWSGLPAAPRLPTREEMEHPGSATDILTRWLTATGGGLRDIEGILAWYDRTKQPPEEDPWSHERLRAAIDRLNSAGWDIRLGRRAHPTYMPGSQRRIEAVAAPGRPMRRPDDGPAPSEPPQIERWPDHAYLYRADLWQVIRTIETDHAQEIRGPGNWTGGGDPTNRLRRSYSQPSWAGQPIPDGDSRLARLTTWASERLPSALADQLIPLAVPGAITLHVDEPVGLVEAAERLGVRRQTADNWRQQGLLPEAPMAVGGRPAWWWLALLRWAVATGRA